MGIKIKQTNQKWRLCIEDEEWEFATRKEMEVGLKTLLDMKEKKGNIKLNERRL